MTRYPHIPMHPSEVPQQRIHAVVDLPRRPDGFEARCDFCDPIPAQDAPSGDPKDVAIWMLIDCWAAEAEQRDVDHFHWIDEAGLLSVAQINAIGRFVWPGAQNEPVSSTVGG